MQTEESFQRTREKISASPRQKVENRFVENEFEFVGAVFQPVLFLERHKYVGKKRTKETP